VADKDKQCITCSHWEREFEDRRTAEYNPNHGLCSIAEMGCADKFDDVPMITLDGSFYMAELWTRSDHGCIEHKERE